MTTPLEHAIKAMRDLIEDVVVSHGDDAYPRMHRALDAVAHEALAAVQAEQPTYEQWQLRYTDLEGVGHTMLGLPGHIEGGPDQLRALAAMLIDGGAREVLLQREVPWHTVESWTAHDDEPKDGPGRCSCDVRPDIDGTFPGPEVVRRDPNCAQHRYLVVDKPALRLDEPDDPFDAGLRDKPDGS